MTDYTLKKLMAVFALATVAAFFAGPVSQGQTVRYGIFDNDGGDGDNLWSNSDNWYDAGDFGADHAAIYHGLDGTVDQIDQPDNPDGNHAILDYETSTVYFNVGDYSRNYVDRADLDWYPDIGGYLVFEEGADLSTDQPQWLAIGSRGAGRVDHNGGIFTATGTSLDIGEHDGTGVYNMNGGTLNIPNHSINVGWHSARRAELNISGGTVTADAIEVINEASTLQLEGADSTISVGGFSWGAGATVEALADDSAEGITTIDVTGDVEFADGALLNVGWVDEPVYDTWTLMTWTGSLTDDGLGFAPGVDENVWSFDINTGNSGSLTITAIPEPSSLVLLGLAGLLLMKRRRV